MAASRPKRRKSDAELYFEDVLSGEIVACAKIKALAAMMLPRFEECYKEWHFDIDAAERPVRFIETECFIPSGKIGKQMLLEPFQKAIVECAFGFVDEEGNRQFRNVLIIEGRKNAKTTLMAALELYMLIADREGAPQIYNIATSKDQASLGYGAAVRMMKLSKRMKKVLRNGVVKERHQDGIINDSNLGYITPLSSQTGHLDGLDVHFGCVDELSALLNRDVYDLVRQGTGARDNPMIFCITTNGFVRDGIFDSEYDNAERWLAGEVEDDRFLAFVYELDDRDEWETEECWIKANPGLGTIKKLEYLKGEVNKAKYDPSYLPTVLTKEFNIPQNQACAWLTYEECVNETVVEDWKSMGFRYGIAGFDAADTIDLNAAKMLMMRDGDPNIYVRSMYWIPETVLEESIRKNRDRDDVPYRQWIARGLMRTYPGNKVDKRVFLDWFQEVESELGIYTFAVGFDPWHVDDSTLRDLQAFVGERNCHKVRQGAITLSQPMKQLRAEYQAHHVIDDHNPVNEFCRLNIEIRPDVNGNIQPNKKQNNPKFRIDGFIAELCAYTVMTNVMDEYLDIIKP